MNTPGLGGYVIAWLVSAALFPLGLIVGVPENSPLQALAGWVLYFPFVVVISVPFAAVGILVVHLACRRIPHQWVHVLAAGLAGAAVVLMIRTPGGDLFAPVVVLPLSTAAGRLCVVPLVRRRRRDSAHSPVRC